MNNPAIDKVLTRCALVFVSTRMPTVLRDTEEGSKHGSKVTKVLQSCYSPDALRPLSGLKSETNRRIRRTGTLLESLGATIVPLEALDELNADLDKIQSRWEGETHVLAESISTRVEDWATLNPDEAADIRRLAPTAHQIRLSSRFLRATLRLRSEDILDQEAVEADLSSLDGRVLYEISLMLKDASLHSSSGAFFTPSVLEVLARVGEKASAMAFISPVLQTVADNIETVVKRLAGSGRIVDVDAVAIHQLIKQLLEPHKLLAQKGFTAPTFVAPAPAAPMTAQPASTMQPASATPVTRPKKTAKAPVPAPAVQASSPTQAAPPAQSPVTPRSFVPGAVKRTAPKPASPVAPAKAEARGVVSTEPGQPPQPDTQAELAAALVI